MLMFGMDPDSVISNNDFFCIGDGGINIGEMQESGVDTSSDESEFVG